MTLPVSPIHCWYTVPEAARALGLKPAELRLLIDDGPVLASKIGRGLMVHSLHLEAVRAALKAVRA